MKVSSTWIQNHLRRTINTETVVAALDQAGIEIEQLIVSTDLDKNIVVCLVKKVVQHPSADRLKIVDIETKSGSYRVICGAPNVRVGLKVPYAQIGAILPSGDKITKAKLRGEMSEGMLCSERELALGSSHEGIMELPPATEAGLPVSDLFPADTIIEMKTPANRFDVLGVRGLAREVAAVTGEELTDEHHSSLELSSNAQVLSATTRAQPHLFVNVHINELKPSPDWMKSRLRAGGMRPVSPLVDITNYVMLEYGQPMHAFDARKLKLPVEARYATAGEQLTTLDGTKLVLTPEDLVIADANGPIGLAGVMGSASSEVDAQTTEIWLEAAIFDAATVRKSAKRHGLRTEASARYERGLPAELASLGMARALELLSEYSNVTVGDAVGQGSVQSAERVVQLNLPATFNMLGFKMDKTEISAILQRLGLEIVTSSKTDLDIRLPWWRPDITLAIDVVEELVRIAGYHRVPSTIPAWRPSRVQFDVRRARLRLVRDSLFAVGLFEVMTYSFVSKEQLEGLGLDPGAHLKLKNPLSVEQEYLRSSLLASHVGVAERNRTYGKNFGMYEVSSVFLPRGGNELPEEPLHLAVTVVREAGAVGYIKGVLDVLSRELNVDLDVKPMQQPGFIEGRAGAIELNGETIGLLGQLDPTVTQRKKLAGETAHFEIDLTKLLEQAQPKLFAGVRRFPVISRDVSLVVPVVTSWNDIRTALNGYDVQYLSEYAGSQMQVGMRSLTLRLTVAFDDRTPTEAEARDAQEKVLRILDRKLRLKPIL